MSNCQWLEDRLVSCSLLCWLAISSSWFFIVYNNDRMVIFLLFFWCFYSEKDKALLISTTSLSLFLCRRKSADLVDSLPFHLCPQYNDDISCHNYYVLKLWRHCWVILFNGWCHEEFGKQAGTRQETIETILQFYYVFDGQKTLNPKTKTNWDETVFLVPNGPLLLIGIDKVETRQCWRWPTYIPVSINVMTDISTLFVTLSHLRPCRRSRGQLFVDIEEYRTIGKYCQLRFKEQQNAYNNCLVKPCPIK